MNKEQYEAFQRSIAESQQRSARTLQRMQKTIEGVQQTMQKIRENNQNIDKFKEAFGQVMNKLAHQIAQGLSLDQPFKKVEGKQYEYIPQKISFKEVVARMMKYKDILIVTGAGVSAPSGIPTFRGKNGLYSKKFEFEGQEYEPQTFITKGFYSEHPNPIWEWIEDIYNMSQKCKPNQIHILIHTLAKLLSSKGKKVTLVTQNIDDLHLKPEKNEYEYHAVHGNVKFVRCNNLHLMKYPIFRDLRKKGDKTICKQCGEQLRPHVLFFDESYGPLYGSEVKQKDFAFVIVIGTSLKTGLCIKLTKGGKEVVEINPQPVIEIGKVYPFPGNTVTTLKSLVEEVKKIK